MPEGDDASLEIYIKTLADTYGVDKVKEAVGGLAKNTAEAGEQTKKFNLHGGEMRHIFRELNQLAPGLGLAVKGMFEPEALGIIAAVIALQKLIELFKEAQKQAEELAVAQVKTAVEFGKAQHDAAMEAKKAIAEWADEVERLNKAQQAGTANIEVLRQRRTVAETEFTRATAELAGQRERGRPVLATELQEQEQKELEARKKLALMLEQFGVASVAELRQQGRLAGPEIKRATEAEEDVKRQVETTRKMVAANDAYAERLSAVTKAQESARTAYEKQTEIFNKAQEEMQARQSPVGSVPKIEGLESLVSKTVAGISTAPGQRTVGQTQAIQQVELFAQQHGVTLQQIIDYLARIRDAQGTMTEKMQELADWISSMDARVKAIHVNPT